MNNSTLNSTRFRKYSRHFLALAVTLVMSSAANAQTLIWSDEFNGSQLDPNAWDIESGTRNKGYRVIDDLIVGVSGRYVRINCAARGTGCGYSLWGSEVHGFSIIR